MRGLPAAGHQQSSPASGRRPSALLPLFPSNSCYCVKRLLLNLPFSAGTGRLRPRCLAGLLRLRPGPLRHWRPSAGSLQRYSRRAGRKAVCTSTGPCYAAGETMWFKVYAVDGTFHRPLDLSKVAYVEVLNSRQPVLQAKIALREATGQGSLIAARPGLGPLRGARLHQLDEEF